MKGVRAFERNARICPKSSARRWNRSSSNSPRDHLRSLDHELTEDGELSCLVSTRPVFSSPLLRSARYLPNLPFEFGRRGPWFACEVGGVRGFACEVGGSVV